MDLRITGTLVPDATGIYTERGTYNGEFYYGRMDDAYYVWSTGFDQWVLSTLPGNPSVHSWIKNSANVIGTYDPWLVATGIATSYIMTWHDYLQAEWQFDENGAGNTFADSKAGLFPLITPSPTITSDYSVVGKFGRGFCPNKIVAVPPYPRTAELADNELVYNEFSLRFWMQVNPITATSIYIFQRNTGGGIRTSYVPFIRYGVGNIGIFVSHAVNTSFGYSIDKGAGYYEDGVWREYLISFKKQVSTPRIKIFINGIDETDYASEASYDEDVLADVLSRFMIAGTVESDYAEYALDRLQIFNKAMVPNDFIGNELIDENLIYPGLSQLRL